MLSWKKKNRAEGRGFQFASLAPGGPGAIRLEILACDA
jgi:hypothetical protein